jgi:hypothetical protein
VEACDGRDDLGDRWDGDVGDGDDGALKAGAGAVRGGGRIGGGTGGGRCRLQCGRTLRGVSEMESEGGGMETMRLREWGRTVFKPLLNEVAVVVVVAKGRDNH